MTFIEFTTANDKKVLINKEFISALIAEEGEVYNSIIETNAGSSFLVKEKYSDVLSKIYSECNNERLIREIVGSN